MSCGAGAKHLVAGLLNVAASDASLPLRMTWVAAPVDILEIEKWCVGSIAESARKNTGRSDDVQWLTDAL